MDETLRLLAAREGAFGGDGINHEGQTFRGEIVIAPVIGARGVAIDFRATGLDGTLHHEEHSLVAPALDGILTHWLFCSNLPAMAPHSLRGCDRDSDRVTIRFGLNDPEDLTLFREEIAIDLWENGDVGYRYAWGMPGAPYGDRSALRMSRIG